MNLSYVNTNDPEEVRRTFQKIGNQLGSASKPTFAGITLTGLTDNSLIYTTSGTLTSLGAATNGQIPIGSTGAVPVLAGITGTTNQVTVTNGAGSITLSLPQDIDTAADVEFADLTLSAPVNIYALSHDSFADFTADEHFLQTAITNVSTALSTGLLKVTTGTGALSVVTDNSGNWDTAYTHSQLTSGNPHSVTKSEIGLGNVENTALSTWAGSANITTLGTITTGTWNGVTIAIANGGTGQTTQQAAIDALTNVSAATNEHVLTKDTGTGNAIWKAAAGGTPGGLDTQVQFNDGGSFGGDSALVWNKTNNQLKINTTVNYTGQQFEVNGTLTASASALYGVAIQFNHAGSGAFSEYDLFVDSGHFAQYTGSGQTSALIFNNWNKSTGAAAPDGSGGNYGFFGTCRGTTTGYNVGGGGWAGNGNVNYGGLFYSIATKNSAKNIGVVAFGLNAGTSPTQIGGYFGLHSTTPSYTSAALIADNGSQTDPIFLGRDNGTTRFAIIDGGNVGINISSPVTQLDVRSQATTTGAIIGASNSNTSDWVALYSGNSSDQYARIFFDSGLTGFQIGTTTSVGGAGYSNKFMIDSSGYVYIYNIKSGATQAGAGAAANELWKTSGHATLPDNVVMIGV